MPWLLWMEKAQASRSGTWVLVSRTPGPPFTVHLSLLISWVTPPKNLTTAWPSLENLSTRPRAPFTRPEDTWARGKKLFVCDRTRICNLLVRSQVPSPLGHAHWVTERFPGVLLLPAGFQRLLQWDRNKKYTVAEIYFVDFRLILSWKKLWISDSFICSKRSSFLKSSGIIFIYHYAYTGGRQ